MQGSPILGIFLIHVRTVLNKCFGDVVALLRVFVEKVHDEVQGGFPVIIGFIDIGSFSYESLY